MLPALEKDLDLSPHRANRRSTRRPAVGAVLEPSGEALLRYLQRLRR